MRNLLYAGIVGPLLFIVVFLVEGFTRPGYSQWRHFVSQLSTGQTGWVQVVNFLVLGLLMLAFAIGLRQALHGSRGSLGAPILFGMFALTLLVSGIFATDPELGYPPGAAEVMTTQGTIHNFAGLAAFTLLAVSCFVMAWHFAGAPGSGRWTVYSIAVGLVVLVMFLAAGTASGMDVSGDWPNAPTGFFQRISIIAGFTWISMFALHLLRKER